VVALGETCRDDPVALPMTLVQLESRYHWYEYGRVPPDGLEARVIDCPLSIEGAAGVIAPATSVGLTVTVSPGEQRDFDAESVTLYEYIVVTVGEAR
jgi:hypothetical protein